MSSLLLLLLLLFLPSLSPLSDTESLAFFLLSADPHGILSPNWTSSDACSARWRGVSCSPQRRVISLILPSLDLRGPLDSLSHLHHLRLLDLHDNRLDGTLTPLLPSLPNLKFIFLSGNRLSGPIPPSIGTLIHLLRIDLSDNDFSGQIPNSLFNLTRLLTLHLQNNFFTGEIPIVNPNLLQLNLSDNQLSGRIPDPLLHKFGFQSFSGNVGLCGPSANFPPCNPNFTIPSNPSSISPIPSNPNSISSKKLNTDAIISIVIGNIILISILFILICAYCCCGGNREENDELKKMSFDSLSKTKGKEENGSESEMQSELVFFEKRRFEVEELLRASAEMLGKGSIGTVYRAVLENGEIVVVKRLKDANPCCFRDFNKYMNLIGGLVHPNLVCLRAYYYAKEEKLLVYDFLPNGTLFSVLHENRKTGRVPLDWTTRLSLVLGAAKGLSHIHKEYNSSKIPHGNIKTSNILITKNGKACLADFGLALLLDPSTAVSRLGAYASPEQSQSRKLSHEADVYAFGVLLLEVLTGRTSGVNSSLPDWVRSVVREEWTAEVFDVELMRYKNIEDEMVAMLHVALACTARKPDDRPVMGEVVRMIQEIRVERSPLGGDDDDDDDSRHASASPSIPTTATEDGRYSCALTE